MSLSTSTTVPVFPLPLPPSQPQPHAIIQFHRSQRPLKSSSLQLHLQTSSDTDALLPAAVSIPSPSASASPSPSPSASSWIESLRSKTRSNLFKEAVSTYICMTTAGIPPDNFAFPAVLKAAAALQDLHLGKQLHAQALKLGYASSSVTVSNTLIHFYGKCGDIGDASQAFDRISNRDQVSWNSMIAAACRFEDWGLAIQLFRSMMTSGDAEPSSFTLVSLALACSNLSKLVGSLLGKQVHAYSLRNGHSETFTVNALIAMYAKLGRVDDCIALFKSFEDRDLVSWNTVISSLSQNKRYLEALLCLHHMVLDGTKPDAVTIASILPACSQLQMFDKGREIHAQALKDEEIIQNSFVASALVDMYSNCRRVDSARHIFDSTSDRKIGLWNAMIAGYAQNEHEHDALKFFIEMETVAGLHSNATTMASVLPACVCSEAFSVKESIHGHVVKKGLERDRYVQNALMDMYARMGRLDIAEAIFEEMQVKDIVSWNTMITAYVLRECHDKALFLLSQIQVVEEDANFKEKDCDGERVNPRANGVTLMTVLPGCAALAALSKGKEIHGYAIRSMLASDVAVGSALVDMYAKCGCLNLSRRAFDQMPVRNVITWNVIIMAYGMHGKGEAALQMFNIMVEEASRAKGAAKPNEVTFIAVFAACSHSGMVKEGLDLFYKMKDDHQVESTPDHYACIVDLLGRAGQVDEAYRIVKTMPSEFDKTEADLQIS
ncbi:hypothetical protein CDL15_Pgr029144 [Punica granatum]|uniref:Pentatricopeptide repeat-containing protein n=1 Tax=Punica granatum TaxID=22663 RepID=A0A218XML3_PUNGR|nr:hypothetical protein CDL15_Pgr029144 [Punica granatum]